MILKIKNWFSTNSFTKNDKKNIITINIYFFNLFSEKITTELNKTNEHNIPVLDSVKNTKVKKVRKPIYNNL